LKVYCPEPGDNTYTGLNYTLADDPPFTTSMNITGSFSLEDPLAPNLSSTPIRDQLLSLDFSDGVATYTLANATIALFSVSTDVSGNIVEWDIVLDIPLPSPTEVGDTTHHLNIVRNIVRTVFGTGDSASLVPCGIVEQGQCVEFGIQAIAAVDTSGIWTASPVTVLEPGSLFLLLSGFAGAEFWRRFHGNK
jgi:hypothetical protein